MVVLLRRLRCGDYISVTDKSKMNQTLNLDYSIPEAECTEETDIATKTKNALTLIGRALAANGYPRKIAKKKSDTEERKGFALIPYVQGTTERIKRVLESHRIEVCVKPLTTLRQILSKPKDPLPKEKKTGVIYSIPCGECETFYIGETGRSLATRQKEHQSYVRLNKTDKSALAEHAHNTGHSISWINTKILDVETRWHQRKWSEACHIAKSTNARDTGRNKASQFLNSSECGVIIAL
ncbi:hypothetical protein QZH41_005243 [Actinostola sp. cb2023]|nr:hypothetical protein QZH41_005243 [Actinostola sp. cb2023]